MDGDGASGTTPIESLPAGLVYGYNAFDNLQSAIDQVDRRRARSWSTAGRYPAAVNVNKTLAPIEARTNTQDVDNPEPAVAISGAVTLDENTTFQMFDTMNLTFGSTVNAVGGTESLTVNGANTLTLAVRSAAVCRWPR